MANVVKTSSLYRFLTHKRKVLTLYKKSLRHLEAWCYPLGGPQFSYERTLLRARFDQNKDETNEIKAAQLLRLGEEEFWVNQHPKPVPLVNNPYEGVMYERFEKDRIPECMIENWTPEDRAMFPDYMANRERWVAKRKEVWPEEMKILQEWDKQNIEADRPLTEELPAAKEKDGYPPFWWRHVARPLMRPKAMLWLPYEMDRK